MNLDRRVLAVQYHKSLHSSAALLKVLLQLGRWCLSSSSRIPSLFGFWNQCLSKAPRKAVPTHGGLCVLWWLCYVPCPLELAPHSSFRSPCCVCGRQLILLYFLCLSQQLVTGVPLTADSALDSFLQTGTTHSPVREQSERKMKNNIRKEPFGKPNKKCYIKINTRAWPFVVLYILKPPIDSLLITCLFYFTDTSLGRLWKEKSTFFIMVVI